MWYDLDLGCWCRDFYLSGFSVVIYLANAVRQINKTNVLLIVNLGSRSLPSLTFSKIPIPVHGSHKWVHSVDSGMSPESRRSYLCAISSSKTSNRKYQRWIYSGSISNSKLKPRNAMLICTVRIYQVSPWLPSWYSSSLSTNRQSPDSISQYRQFKSDFSSEEK